MSTKVEFQLRKVISGQKWASLEGSEIVDEKGPGQDDSMDAASESVRRAILGSKTNNAGPVYPTSSKSGPKDWDKLANDLTTSKDKKDGTDDTADDEEGDPVNGFFKKLYANSDPDTRRAMMKSYTESNGTALSTNWSEVGKGKVETSPPEGLVAKKWGE